MYSGNCHGLYLTTRAAAQPVPSSLRRYCGAAGRTCSGSASDRESDSRRLRVRRAPSTGAAVANRSPSQAHSFAASLAREGSRPAHSPMCVARLLSAARGCCDVRD